MYVRPEYGCLSVHPTVIILQPKTKSTYEILQIIKKDPAELQTPGPSQDLRHPSKTKFKDEIYSKCTLFQNLTKSI